MKTDFEQKLRALLPEATEKKVFVAVSGGVDSMALLALCYQIGLNPTALHCNFKLRGSTSDLDEALVKSFCETHDLGFETIAFDTKNIAERKSQSIQLCARELRYNWFKQFLESHKNAVLLTAHHADDAVETFFINLLRGTGLKGLTGIPEKRQAIYRPLLTFKKAEIVNFAESNTIPYRNDESNADTNYTRNKIRHEIIPVLAELGPELVQKMGVLMADLKETDDFLEAYANQHFKSMVSRIGKADHISASTILELPYPILLKTMAKYNVQRHQLSEILKLCEAQTGAMFKNDDYVFLKDRTSVIVQQNEAVKVVHLPIATIPSVHKIGNLTLRFSVINWEDVIFSPAIAYLNHALITDSLVVSNQTKGEKIQPFGMKGSKLISDLMTDAKMNRFDKENQLIIKHKTDTVWVVGKTIHHQFAVDAETKKILKIELLE